MFYANQQYMLGPFTLLAVHGGSLGKEGVDGIEVMLFKVLNGRYWGSK